MPGKRIWIVEHLHVVLSAFGCSHSAVAATERFKCPGSTDEYVLTLLATASLRVCEILLIPYLAASVWNSWVQVLRSHVWIVTAVSRILQFRLPVRLPTYRWDFSQPYFKEYTLSFHDVSFLVTLFQGRRRFGVWSCFLKPDCLQFVMKSHED